MFPPPKSESQDSGETHRLVISRHRLGWCGCCRRAQSSQWPTAEAALPGPSEWALRSPAAPESSGSVPVVGGARSKSLHPLSLGFLICRMWIIIIPRASIGKTPPMTGTYFSTW